MKRERYEIYKDKSLIAAWDEGDDGMTRELFEKEFESCVSYWRSQGSRAIFEMRIVVLRTARRDRK